MDQPSWRAEIIDEIAGKQKAAERMRALLDICIGLYTKVADNYCHPQPGVWGNNVRPGPDNRANAIRSGPRANTGSYICESMSFIFSSMAAISSLMRWMRRSISRTIESPLLLFDERNPRLFS